MAGDSSRRVALFTRLPAPGRTKTRLVPPLTPGEAASLQRAMTEDLLERLARDLAPTTDLELRVAGSAERPPPPPLAAPPEWRTVPQGGGDLGARLRRTVHTAFGDGLGSVVLIGADAPLLPTGLIESAFTALDAADAVLAPSEDGGYVLLALATDRGAARFDLLFEAKPWGTPAIATATRTAARDAGLTLHPLPSHWDVDRPRDLDRLAAESAALPPTRRPPRTAAFLEALTRRRRSAPLHGPKGAELLSP